MHRSPPAPYRPSGKRPAALLAATATRPVPRASTPLGTQRFAMVAGTLLVIGSLLAGCSLAPQHQRPSAPVPERYPVVSSSWNVPECQALFADPRLRALVDQALGGNRDLRLAALDIQQARTRYRISRADLGVELNATASRTRERSQAGAGASPAGEAPADVRITDRYSVGLGTSAYELDLFGRLRDLRHAALDDYLAQRETRLGVELSLIAEVATAYLNQLALDERLALSRSILASRQRALALIAQRREAGVSSALDLAQAHTSVEIAAADVAILERTRAQADNGLRLLLGGDPARELPPPLPLARQGLDHALPAGLPAELLARRPDIRAAEYRLRAANANIGAARAAFFPRITLTATAGYVSSDLTGLFEAGNRSWSFVPQLQVPLFDGGRTRANLELAEVRRDQDVVRYERSIQLAFREVADQLVAEGPLTRQLAAQQRLRDATARSLELATDRYVRGLDNYLTVLDSQRSLHAADNALIETRLQLMISRVELFRALGGEWRPSDART